ncbi:MAG: TrkH family potassium uptake protein [Lachnospiraceae bacterium]|nr:TrkH family potassium uptake protein [Lachnospiraceae bacterium]
MNISIVRYLLGQILKIEAILLLFPCIVAFIFREKQGLCFLIVSAVSALLGILLAAKKPKNNVFYLKEGCVTTASSWIILSLVGCLPFYISREIPSFTNALFETVSGFTTTGASILSDIESLSKCMLFWRSFTHWIGGMGVLVFLLAIAPMAGGSNMNLMKAESTGPSVGKLVPKVRTTARILYLLYLILTIVQFLFLILGNVPVFDSICIALGTAGTGGYSIKNDGFASYSPYCIWVTGIFMVLFGVNFNFYYLFLYKKIKKALQMEEVRTYFTIILVSVLIICIFNIGNYTSFVEGLMHSFFQVASIITTTGFASIDFDQWEQVPKLILLALMFVGGCAGSTAGGIKVSRIIIFVKTVFKELLSYIHPKSIKKIQLDHKPIEHEVIRATNVYLIIFILIFLISLFFISFENKDFTTNFSAIAATLNNIGPGLSMVGPMCNFDHFSIFSKYVMIFDMLAGRLELFPLLLLFHPALWKEYFSSRKGTI